MIGSVVALSCLLGATPSILAKPQVFTAPAYASAYAPAYAPAYASAYAPAYASAYAPAYASAYAPAYAPGYSYYSSGWNAFQSSPYFQHYGAPSFYGNAGPYATVDTHPLNQPDNYPYFYLKGKQSLPQFVADSNAVLPVTPAGLTYAPAASPIFSSPLYLNYASTAVSSESSTPMLSISPDFDEEVVEADSKLPVVSEGSITLRNIIPIFESDLRTDEIIYVKPGDTEATEAVAAAAAGGVSAIIVPDFS